MHNREMIPWLYLALGFTQAAHSVEEVLTDLWKNMAVVSGMIHSRFSLVPVMNWSVEGFAAANLAIVAVILGLSPFIFQKRSWASWIVCIAAVIEVLNGLIHIIPAIITGGYWPGCISAVFLLGIGMFILIKMGRAHGSQNV